MTPGLYPVVLDPVILAKPWGEAGRAPGLVPGADPTLKVGEVWLTADGPLQSTVANGPLQGTSLAGLRSAWGASLLGRRLAGREDQPLPLLLKLLHSADYLSVQVHPDDESARKVDGALSGKTEAWYIVEAREAAELVLGLRPGIGIEALRGALAQGRVAEVLNRIQVEPGQTFYVHAGLLHTIGPGVTLLEIQRNTDLTYRFYDWDRQDEAGRPRPLHVEKALTVVDLAPANPAPFYGLTLSVPGLESRLLAADPYFALEWRRLRGSWTGNLKGEYFEVLTALSGRAFIRTDGPAPVAELAPGRSALLPAHMGDYSLEAPGGVVFLRAWFPDLVGEVIGPLRTEGHAPEAIAALAGGRRPNDLTPYL
ncbi:MAG: class I mannose-6-phosphate isomerase [Proteobacteria bacterium]|nr:class I mannose-6-phosphate isomerase [Pseudomonadota bacterium]